MAKLNISKAAASKHIELTFDKDKHVFKDGSGRAVKHADYWWSIAGLAKHIKASRDFIAKHVRPAVRYVYFGSKMKRAVLRDFFGINPDAPGAPHVYRVYLNTDDVFKWFKDSFVYGRKSYQVTYAVLFRQADRQQVAGLLASYYHAMPGSKAGRQARQEARQGLAGLVKDAALFAETAAGGKTGANGRKISFDDSGFFPLVPRPMNLDADGFRSAYFHAYKDREYGYPAVGRRELLASSADVYQLTPEGASHAKTLFVPRSISFADADWLESVAGAAHPGCPQIEIRRTASQISNDFVIPAASAAKFGRF